MEFRGLTGSIRVPSKTVVVGNTQVLPERVSVRKKKSACSFVKGVAGSRPSWALLK